MGAGGYGGLMDCNNVLWSVGTSGNSGVFRYDTDFDIADNACCQPDILADINFDGIIDTEDNEEEDTLPIYFAVNSDDDNGNGQYDFDDPGPVYGEDNLQEIQLFVPCYIDPIANPDAWWSLTWGDPVANTSTVWLQPDKSDGNEGNPGPGIEIPNGVPIYEWWPPPATVWLESLETVGETELVFEVSPGQGRAVQSDTLSYSNSCTPAPGSLDRYHIGHDTPVAIANITGLRAKISRQSTAPLCNENEPPPSRQTSGSLVYIGIEQPATAPDGTGFLKWLQVGYLASYKKKEPAVSRGTYFEFRYGPNLPADVLTLLKDPVEPGETDYSIMTILDGTPWVLRATPENGAGWYETIELAEFPAPATGIISITGEIANREDRLAGDDSNRCRFTEIAYRKNWNQEDLYWPTPQATLNYSPEDDPWIQQHAASEWGLWELCLPPICVPNFGFEIWDKKPIQP